MKPKFRGIIVVGALCLIAATWLDLLPLGYFWQLGITVTSIFVLLRYGLSLPSLWPTGVNAADAEGQAQTRQCDRLGTIVWLLCAAAIAGLGLWYPIWVMNKNSGPDIDDRSGVILMAAMPFYFLAVIIALRGVIRLGGAAIKERSTINVVTGIAGLLLAAIAVSPVVMIVIRLSKLE